MRSVVARTLHVSARGAIFRYDGYVLDIPLSDGIEEFVYGIKSASIRRGKELLFIQVRNLPPSIVSPRKCYIGDCGKTQ